MNLPIQNKKQETLTLIIMALLLAIVLLVSKFVLGINFSLMEHGSYVAFGYHEIRGDEIWAMSFDSFSGTISEQGTFPDGAKRRLLVYSGTETGNWSWKWIAERKRIPTRWTAVPWICRSPGMNPASSSRSPERKFSAATSARFGNDIRIQ